MFDRKSDYALNKQDPDAIVCKSVTEVHIRLTRADFASEAEFHKWKLWSDQDYRTTENAGRALSDNTLSLEAHLDCPLPSPEEELLEAMDADERRAARLALANQLRSCLTEKQLRRLRLYYLEGMNEAEIAVNEGVSQQAVSLCIRSAKNILQKFQEVGDLTL